MDTTIPDGVRRLFPNILLDVQSIDIVLEFIGPVDAAAVIMTNHVALTCERIESFWQDVCLKKERSSFDPGENRLADVTRWRSAFANLYGAQCAKDSRRLRLEAALASRGLAVRSDSYLCASYVNDGSAAVEGGLSQVVDTMAEMAFFFSMTTYASEREAIEDYLHERAVSDAAAAVAAMEEPEISVHTYFERLDKHQLSEIAKGRALREYVQRLSPIYGRVSKCESAKCVNDAIIANVPKSLHGKIHELLTVGIVYVDPIVQLLTEADFSMQTLGGDEDATARRARLRDQARQVQNHMDEYLAPHIEMVQRFAEQAEVGDQFSLPPGLSSDARARLHAFAEDAGLQHESRGVGAERSLVVSRVF